MNGYSNPSPDDLQQPMIDIHDPGTAQSHPPNREHAGVHGVNQTAPISQSGIDKTEKNRHLKLIGVVVFVLIGFLWFSIQNDIEHQDEFNFTKCPFGALNHTYDSRVDTLFPWGIDSIKPSAIIQGQICDCKFLSTTAALVALPSGREQILKMIHPNHDGTYTVTFGGAPDQPVTVAEPTRQELYYSARTSDENGYYRFGNGIWLPVLEKAYGAYRNAHQPLDRAIIRVLKHGLLEGRFDASSKLPSFGAAYGAFDEEACRIYTGHSMKLLDTVSWELGDFGLGKAHVSGRQLRSWIGRQAVIDEIYAEQNNALTEAFSYRKLVIATTEGGTNVGETGIKSHHAYAVLGYSPTAQTLTLRDPLGSSVDMEYKVSSSSDFADGKLDGQFEISLKEFNKIFSKLAIQT